MQVTKAQALASRLKRVAELRDDLSEINLYQKAAEELERLDGLTNAHKGEGIPVRIFQEGEKPIYTREEMVEKLRYRFYGYSSESDILSLQAADYLASPIVEASQDMLEALLIIAGESRTGTGCGIVSTGHMQMVDALIKRVTPLRPPPAGAFSVDE